MSVWTLDLVTTVTINLGTFTSGGASRMKRRKLCE
jgi:hypothetical protein